MFSGDRLICNIVINCHIVDETECLNIKLIEAQKKVEIR